MKDLELKISKIISVPIEKVFDVWLNPEILAKFMQPMENMSDAKVTTNPVVGGKFSITMIGGDLEMPHKGTYLEIVRPNRLVFT